MTILKALETNARGMVARSPTRQSSTTTEQQSEHFILKDDVLGSKKIIKHTDLNKSKEDQFEMTRRLGRSIVTTAAPEQCAVVSISQKRQN